MRQIISMERADPYYLVTETELGLFLLLGNAQALLGGMGGALLGLAASLAASVLAGATWTELGAIRLYVLASVLGALGLGAMAGTTWVSSCCRKMFNQIRTESTRRL